MNRYEQIKQNEDLLKTLDKNPKTYLFYYEWYKKYLAVKKIERKKTNAKKIVCNCGINYKQLCRAIETMEEEL